MLEVRAAVRTLPQYSPPERDDDALLCDLNENLAGCSPRVLAALRKMTTATVARYPDRIQGERAAAEFLRVAPEQVLLTNGVDEALHLICQTYLADGDEALIVTPTFGMYGVYAAATGARVIEVRANSDFSFPGERVLRAITPRTRFIALATPNNPTGAVIERYELLAIAKAAPYAAVVVDEAYWEFHGETILDVAGEFANLFITRTFSKAYGMAGLRLGALIGNGSQIAGVRRLASPFNVNAAALACLPAALDREYVSACVAEIQAGRERLAAALRDLGFHTWPSGGNFILARIGERVTEFVAAMADNGVMVRDRSSEPGCNGCVRITVGPSALVDQVIAAMKAATCASGIRPEARP